MFNFISSKKKGGLIEAGEGAEGLVKDSQKWDRISKKIMSVGKFCKKVKKAQETPQDSGSRVDLFN